ncbi:anti-sigma factor family protein [Calycomorphotria hydatis]|uniref:Putative zinc-finger domain-containing protein n=1 Tax=Calycomorphotria hydatis TaxID=2528027 RepID=A0A517T4D2_9PLAN|nr:zf-HC2 domain-containing protein [Calycomorphotria hydatis]QDT63234.1 hypothetical protein V22_04530 [Calycomorphotria hydatis]
MSATSSETNTPAEDDWLSCPEGTISAMSGQLRRRRQVRMYCQASAVAALILLAVFVPATLYSQFNNQQFTRLTCADVGECLADYNAGKLSEEMAGRVEAHLDHCVRCREALEALQHKPATVSLDRAPHFAAIKSFRLPAVIAWTR